MAELAELKGKKALSLCLLRVLERYASPENPMTTRELIGQIKSEYGMDVERKAVGRNLLLLSEMGFALSTYQENGKGYYLQAAAQTEKEENPAQETQLFPHRGEGSADILLDGLLRAPTFPDSAAMLEQLQGQTPIYPIPELTAYQSEGLLYTLQTLKGAIARKVQISFSLNSVQPDGTLRVQRQKPITVSPYALVFAEARYYALVSISGYGKLLHYPCEWMGGIAETQIPARAVTELTGCEQGLDPQSYVMRNIYHQDEAETHEIFCARHLAGELYAAFGKACEAKEEGDHMRAKITAPWVSVRRFLLVHLKHATLLAPEARTEQFHGELAGALACYSS